MKFLGKIDESKDIINKEFVDSLLGDYQPLITNTNKIPFPLISELPTTLSGYGITDAYTKTQADARYLLSSSYTASDILTKLKTVDGAGSGLDADTLDGYQGSVYRPMLSLTPGSDYTDFVIALCTLDNSNTSLNSYSHGDIYMHRNNGASNLSTSIRYSCKKMYNQTNAVFGILTNGANLAKRCTFVYNGVKYAGLVVLQSGACLNAIQVAGYWSMTPFVVNYNHHKDGVINSEINDSLVVDGDDVAAYPYTYGYFNGSLSGNATSATKLKTARTIWGQSFDGTGNVDGLFTITSSSGRPFKIGWMVAEETVQLWSWLSGSGFADMSIGASKDTPSKALYFKGADGYWGIGTTSPAYKLDVNGTFRATGNSTIGGSLGVTGATSLSSTLSVTGTTTLQSLRVNGTTYQYNTDKTYRLMLGHNVSSSGTNVAHLYNIKDDGSDYGELRIGGTGGAGLVVTRTNRVGIGTTSPSYKLHVAGDIYSSTNIRAADSVYVNGIRMYKSQDGVICIDGNLAVKGGITMYATDAIDVPSIIDSLPVAGYTSDAKGVAAFDSTQFSITDGVVKYIGSAGSVDSTFLSNYLVTNNYATKSDIPTSLKNPNALSINNSSGAQQVSYDGSDVKSLTLTKAMVGLGNVENTALSSWTGSSKITTLGTISSGTWKGTKIANDYLANNAITINGTSTALGGSFNTASITAGTAGTSSATNGYTLSVPYVTVNKYGIVTAYGTHIHTVKSIPNSSLDNSSVKISGTSVSLGGEITQTALRTALGLGSAAYKDASGSWGISVTGSSASCTGNAASATKLQTARTIWGRSFNGTGNIDGKIKLTDWDSDGVAIRFENTGKTSAYLSFYSTESNAYTVGQNGSRFLIAHNTYGDIFNVLNGNVLIGTTTDGGYKLDVNGNIRCGQVYYSDNFRYLAVGVGSNNAHYVNFGEYDKDYYTAINLNANGATRFIGADSAIKVLVDHSTGNVGIGTTSPSDLLDVNGVIRCTGVKYSDGTLYLTMGVSANGRYINVGEINNPSFHTYLNFNASAQARWIGNAGTVLVSIDHTNGNFLTTGGITMYSDIRKKTKLQDIELSLKQIADAPLIEHYYNSDDKKTTHVGSIAQYWAGLNDWFCKLDNEGYYTMEIQNAALASAISIARELVKYESKTDKKIRMLKKRISELEDKIELLEKKGE